MTRFANWRDLERELRKLGYTIEKGRTHKRILNGAGKCVGSLPTSCSDWRGIKNKVGELRARGILPYADGRFAAAPIDRVVS